MNPTIKNALGVVIILALVALGIVAFKYVDAYSRSMGPWSVRTFSVSGEGKAVGVPDIAEVMLSVTTEGGTNLAALQEENIEKMNAVVDFVKSEGVEEEDITTTQYNVTPRYQSCIIRDGSGTCPPPSIVGYTIRQSVRVKVRDFDVIGSILSGAVGAGANNVSGPNFRIDDPESVRMEAREKAIAQARAKAEQIALSAGFKVGRLLSIDEGYYPVPYYAGGFGGDAAREVALPAAAPAPSIEPGSEEVSVSLNLIFEMK